MKNKLLTIKHLEKNYHDITKEISAVDDVSLEVNKGDFIPIDMLSQYTIPTVFSYYSKLLKII